MIFLRRYRKYTLKSDINGINFGDSRVGYYYCGDALKYKNCRYSIAVFDQTYKCEADVIKIRMVIGKLPFAFNIKFTSNFGKITVNEVNTEQWFNKYKNYTDGLKITHKSTINMSKPWIYRHGINFHPIIRTLHNRMTRSRFVKYM